MQPPRLRPGRALLLIAPLTALLSCAPTDAPPAAEVPELRHYIAYRLTERLEVDGKLAETSWGMAPWSEPFVDIEGAAKPAPRFRTRVKMLWDDTFFYIGAELDEPHVWATLTEHDSVIYHDNDFELFVDPDGDTHEYYELEINALGTVWDLFLVKPYRDGGTAENAWEIPGLESAVWVEGSVNDPSDRDVGWSVELALPWAVLARHAPDGRGPRDGEQWRVNFSRVEWKVEVSEGRYEKTTNPSDGKPFPEQNWVWSPQGAVNMHMPEMWGIVQFSKIAAGDGEASFRPPPDLDVQWALRQLYQAQRAHLEARGRYAHGVDELDLDLRASSGARFRFKIVATSGSFEASVPGASGATVWHIRQDGKIWRQRH